MPFIFRHLKPYIFRDPVTKPLWLRMLNELKEYFIKKKGLPKSNKVETIDYSYVRAKHIQSVNTLATQFFWPGIDCKYFCCFIITLYFANFKKYFYLFVKCQKVYFIQTLVSLHCIKTW